MEITIRDYIKRELKEKDQKPALAYVDFLEENNLEIRKDNGEYWKDNIYYWILYKDICVAFIAIKDPTEPDTDWTVYSDDIKDEYLLEEYVTDDEKKIAFKHIDRCRCGGGPKKMFGEDVEWCCGTNFRFNAPTMEELPFMKKMVLLKIKEHEVQVELLKELIMDGLQILTKKAQKSISVDMVKNSILIVKKNMRHMQLVSQIMVIKKILKLLQIGKEQHISIILKKYFS